MIRSCRIVTNTCSTSPTNNFLHSPSVRDRHHWEYGFVDNQKPPWMTRDTLFDSLWCINWALISFWFPTLRQQTVWITISPNGFMRLREYPVSNRCIAIVLESKPCPIRLAKSSWCFCISSSGYRFQIRRFFIWSSYPHVSCVSRLTCLPGPDVVLFYRKQLTVWSDHNPYELTIEN